MDIAARIGKVGFRKWYERELIDCHLSFTTCFLSGVTVAACLEGLWHAEFGWKPVSLFAVVLGAIALGWYSWRRYILVLERAEIYGSRSNCPACGTYGRFEILATGQNAVGPHLDPDDSALPRPWLRVRCRKCTTVWRLPD